MPLEVIHAIWELPALPVTDLPFSKIGALEHSDFSDGA
jgi:hypothetical protein